MFLSTDGVSDRALAELVSGTAKIVYISSTTIVYGQTSGKINEESAVDSSQARLQAEEIWRASGSIVLRAPGLYSGVDSMLKRITGATIAFQERWSQFCLTHTSL
ncbi:MAG: hypothetical protein IPJ49_30775 [Candidatus Obscuribacter sp.]|nr:hypothetical protein [Candidatus Obscuribacter sp.]